MRDPVRNMREQLQRLREDRAVLAATRVVVHPDNYVVVTLAPRHTSRLLGRGGSPAWETRVYITQPPRFGVGVQPHYVVLDAGREEARARHETLLRRLETGSFAQETSREILQALRQFMDLAGNEYTGGDTQTALAALEEALRTARCLDAARRFLHLYVDVFLMRGLVLEHTDREAAKAAYREFIALHAEHPFHHPDTLDAVAWAREALERLTPMPSFAATREGVEMAPAKTERLV